MLFTVPSTGGFLKKTILSSVFKNPYKKIRETRKCVSIQGIENQTKPESDITPSLCPEISAKNDIQEFNLYTGSNVGRLFCNSAAK
jgi:hypothetical protein